MHRADGVGSCVGFRALGPGGFRHGERGIEMCVVDSREDGCTERKGAITGDYTCIVALEPFGKVYSVVSGFQQKPGDGDDSACGGKSKREPCCAPTHVAKIRWLGACWECKF